MPNPPARRPNLAAFVDKIAGQLHPPGKFVPGHLDREHAAWLVGRCGKKPHFIRNMASRHLPHGLPLALIGLCALPLGESSSVAPTAFLFPTTDGCTNGCSGHGTCYWGVCKCEPGWLGSDCSLGAQPSPALARKLSHRRVPISHSPSPRMPPPPPRPTPSLTLAARCPSDCCGPSHGLCLAGGTCECQDGFGPANPDLPNDCCGRTCTSDCGSAAGPCRIRATSAATLGLVIGASAVARRIHDGSPALVPGITSTPGRSLRNVVSFPG